jgi:hypothetical protein
VSPSRSEGRWVSGVSGAGWLPLAFVLACREGGGATEPEPEPEPPPAGFALALGTYSGPLALEGQACGSDLGLKAWVPTVREVSEERATLVIREGIQITCTFDGPNQATCAPFEYDAVSPAGSYVHLRSEPTLTVTSDESFDLVESLTITCNLGDCPDLGGPSCEVEAREQFTPVDLWWDANAVWVHGEFGYDRDSHRVVPFRRDGVEVPITVVLSVFDYPLEEGCDVVLEHQAPVEPEEYTTELELSFFFLGFKLPGGAWTVGEATTCDTGADRFGSSEWDPYRWGEDAAATLAGKEWGLGVGPGDDITGYGTLEPITSSFGGLFFSSRLGFDFYSLEAQEGFGAWNRATGCRVDASGAVIGSGGACEPIPPEEVESALLVGELPSGAYTVHPGTGFGVQNLLY